MRIVQQIRVDLSSSFSPASSFIVGLLTEVLLRGFPTWDDRFQDDRVLVFDEWHELHVALAPDDEYALPCVRREYRGLVTGVPPVDSGKKVGGR